MKENTLKLSNDPLIKTGLGGMREKRVAKMKFPGTDPHVDYGAGVKHKLVGTKVETPIERQDRKQRKQSHLSPPYETRNRLFDPQWDVRSAPDIRTPSGYTTVNAGPDVRPPENAPNERPSAETIFRNEAERKRMRDKEEADARAREQQLAQKQEQAEEQKKQKRKYLEEHRYSTGIAVNKEQFEPHPEMPRRKYENERPEDELDGGRGGHHPSSGSPYNGDYSGDYSEDDDDFPPPPFFNPNRGNPDLPSQDNQWGWEQYQPPSKPKGRMSNASLLQNDNSWGTNYDDPNANPPPKGKQFFEQEYGDERDADYGEERPSGRGRRPSSRRRGKPPSREERYGLEDEHKGYEDFPKGVKGYRDEEEWQEREERREKRAKDRYRPRDYYEDQYGVPTEESYDEEGPLLRKVAPRGGYPGGNPWGGDFKGASYTPQGSSGWTANASQGGDGGLLGGLGAISGGIGGLAGGLNPAVAGVQAVGAGWNIVKDMFGINEYRERQKIEAAEKQREKERAEREDERLRYINESQQQRKQRIAQEKNDAREMSEKMIKDQERAVRSAQYGEQNAYGNVSWEGDIHKGTRKLVSKLDELQQKKKDRALAMTDEISDKDAIGQMAKGVQESILSQYHRNTDEQYNQDVKKAQERLLSRGLTESSAAWRKTMKNLSDAREKELANVNDRAVEQGHKYGNEAFKQKMDVYDKMNQFVDPLDLYKSTSGIGTEHLGSVVLPAANYAAGRSDVAAEQAAEQHKHLLEMRKEANREDQAYRDRIQNQKMQDQLLQHQDKTKYIDQEHEKGLLGGKYYHEAQMKGGDYEHDRRMVKGKYYHEARMQDDRYSREEEEAERKRDYESIEAGRKREFEGGEAGKKRRHEEKILGSKYYHEDIADQRRFDHEYEIAREKLEHEDISEEQKIYHAERMAKAKIKADRQAADEQNFNEAQKQHRAYQYTSALDREDFARKDKHSKQILEQQHAYNKSLKKIDRNYEKQAKVLEKQLDTDGDKAKFLLDMERLRETKKINRNKLKEAFEYGGQILKHGQDIYRTYHDVKYKEKQLEQQGKQFGMTFAQKERLSDKDYNQRKEFFDKEFAQKGEFFDKNFKQKNDFFTQEMGFKKEQADQIQKNWAMQSAENKRQFEETMKLNKLNNKTQIKQWEYEMKQRIADGNLTRAQLAQTMAADKDNKIPRNMFHALWDALAGNEQEKKKTAGEIYKDAQDMGGGNPLEFPNFNE
jgi:hypothetical protein